MSREPMALKPTGSQGIANNGSVSGLGGHIMNLDFSEELNKWHLVEPSKLFDVEPILVIREDNTNYVKALAY